jgi:DNA-directed RNA polymerase specialized sigma24 family protein
VANRQDAAELVKQLHEEHYEAVYRYLYLSGSTPADADEFIQEAFLRMFQALRDGGHIERPRNWLLRVAQNLRIESAAVRKVNYTIEWSAHLTRILFPPPWPEGHDLERLCMGTRATLARSRAKSTAIYGGG